MKHKIHLQSYKPNVSVIVPVYNVKPEFIQQALESLLNQTIQDIEIIVVNDCSSDIETVKYLAQIQSNPRIKYIKLCRNSGLSCARNAGLQIATGNYVGFLDSDDWVSPDFYEKLYTNCLKYKCDISCGILRLCDNGIYTNLDNHTTLLAYSPESKYKYISNGSVASKLFKRELFNNIKFPKGRLYEDNVVLLKTFIAAKQIFFDDSVFYNYRSNPASIVHNPVYKNKRVRDNAYILGQIHKIAKQQPKKDCDLITDTFLKILFLPNEYINNFLYRFRINFIFGKKHIKKFYQKNN